MKKIYIIPLSCMLISMLSLYSCKKDSFLNRYPVSSITAESFFNNAADLNTYCNSLYSYVPGSTSVALNDQQSDNYESRPFNLVTAGQITIPATASASTAWNGASWSWLFLYQVNYFLENYQKAVATPAVIDHYVGVARFFRAWFYFDKVKAYGDVPFYGRTVTTADNADLYKARDPRALVIDSVMADLKYAAKYVNSTGPSGTITKWAALALMARVGLYEGTYREYRSISGWQQLLQTADSAALVVMQSGQFKLFSTGNPNTDYQNLFITHSPSDPQSAEIILGKFYSNTIPVYTPLDGDIYAYGVAFSKAFMNNYLTSSGTPFTSVPGYDTMMIKGEFTNRDPRMKQSVLPPTVTYGNLNGAQTMTDARSGYLQIKYYDPATPSYNTNYNAAIEFRLGEMLLVYAEAKAELANSGGGTFTQADLDMSVNLLRDRAGMPHLLMTVPIDPVLAANYSNVSGQLENVLLEIRRERRVELACEGLRYDDIMRWKNGPLLAKPGFGMYFPGLGTYDLNGDGVPDIALVTSLPANKVTGISYFVLGTDFGLSNGTSGNIVPNPGLVKTFTDPKDYLMPLPTQELLLNKNLKQNPGW
ncbi:Starch-binding associating with outer membrane [Mucilaginibacter mallensis]|uniref:Starch-binding associating with outer membrane n=1 Tax=Mucilaginibacter mallensis TaxID=652787 RepID=A0A1H1YT66_MUCMA|nr:RagB/SusD family nutrient uptake outer membrane protein [Mucilaginibacter mallensis]SDT24715.1 Starch-binding associating with outer membrane [Mucilaginibacter mallensis]